MAEQEFDVAKGNRDWYGSDAVLRNKIRERLQAVYETYGFEAIETPMIETAEAIAFKGGGEIQKEVFQLTDQGQRKLALRFDQTVPFARFLATHREIPLPFKRYVMGPVFRDGPTQPEQGRYRQFWQCDVDVAGVKEMAAEAELFCLAQDAFSTLGLGNVEVKISNRKLLDGIMETAGVPLEARLRTIVTLDKMDKLGREGVEQALYNLTFSDDGAKLSNDMLVALAQAASQGDSSAAVRFRNQIVHELGEKGYNDINHIIQESSQSTELFQRLSNYQRQGDKILSPRAVRGVLDMVRQEGSNRTTFEYLAGKMNSDRGLEGLAEVEQLLDYSDAMGIDFLNFDPSLARGLQYYTGTTMEIYLRDRSILGSAIGGGGRFDDMIGDFRGGGEEVPAVGFSFGLERVAMVIASQNPDLPRTNTQLYIIPMGTTGYCLKLANDLRKKGVRVDMATTSGKLKKHMGYASGKGFPYVAIVGENEVNSGRVTIKNMKTQEQAAVAKTDIVDALQIL